jgi:protein-disulfide isomerase
MKPSVFLACAVSLAAIAGCSSKQGDAATNRRVKLEQVRPAKSGDWRMVVNPTAAGGFVMGNPAAKVKLIEFGSLTCPHCRAFDQEGVPSLVGNYVKSGQVSWEFRNYVRDAFDLTAALLARCNGARSFFPLARGLYKDQQSWVDTIAAIPQGRLDSLQNLPPGKEFVALARVAGLQSWAAAHGLPASKSTQCLSNEKSVNQLVQMTSDATAQYPDFPGTPTFILNGTMLKDTASWDALEPQLKTALGERG